MRDGDRTLRLSKQRAMVKSIVARAIKGDARASAKAFELLLRAFGIDDEVAADGALAPQDAAILEAFLTRNARSPS